MKYYVIEITKYNDGSKDAYGVYAKDSRDEAIQLYHQKMASAMGSGKVSHELIHIVNDYGVVIESEYFERIEEQE